MTDPAENDKQESSNTTRASLNVEDLPFTQVRTENSEELLRQWIFKEVHRVDPACNQSTIDYCERAYQWIKNGKPSVALVK